MKNQRLLLVLTVLNILLLVFTLGQARAIVGEGVEPVLAKRQTTSLKLINQDGRERVIEP